MSRIQRIESNPRPSRSVVHNGVAWLSGIVAADCSQDIVVRRSRFCNEWTSCWLLLAVTRAVCSACRSG